MNGRRYFDSPSAHGSGSLAAVGSQGHVPLISVFVKQSYVHFILRHAADLHDSSTSEEFSRTSLDLISGERPNPASADGWEMKASVMVEAAESRSITLSSAPPRTPALAQMSFYLNQLAKRHKFQRKPIKLGQTSRCLVDPLCVPLLHRSRHTEQAGVTLVVTTRRRMNPTEIITD